MMILSAATLALLALPNLSLAVSAYTQQICTTKLGKTSVHSVPSTTITISIPLTAYTKTTSTPVSTVTPAPVTATATSTATATNTVTASTNTQTATATITNTITDTSTQTATESSTATTTSTVVSTSTSTSATPAGFTPISQEPGYVPKIKGRDILALEPRGTSPCKASFPKGAKTPVFSPPLFPTAIVCAKLVETISTKTISYTATTTQTTTLAPVTQTTTSTTTTTVTTTVTPPDVTTTTTATTSTTTQVTTTSTTTVVTTATATATSVVPGPTYYAACASNNIINSANGGQYISQVSAAGAFVQVSASSPYDCCAACQQTASCRGSYYGGGNFCSLAAGGDCLPGQFRQYDEFNTDSTSTSNLAFYVSNGPCGLIRNAGSIG